MTAGAIRLTAELLTVCQRERAGLDAIVNIRDRAVELHQHASGADRLAATELIRRAERAMGQAIRRGQEDGTYFPVGRTAARPGPDGRQAIKVPHVFANTTERRQVYFLTDRATDEQFERAIQQGLAEGNLSRAHLVHVVAELTRPPAKRPEVLRKTRRFDSTTVIGKTVEAAAGVITPSLLAEVDLGELDTEDLREWIDSLGDSVRSISALKAQLSKELTHR
jgi:hypothetical protein